MIVRLMVVAMAALTLGACAAGSSARELGRKYNGTALSGAAFENRITPGTDPKSVRREMVLTLLAQSDRDCEDYLIGMAAYRNTTSLALDLTSLGLSSLGGLLSPAETANILSAGSTLSQSAERTAEENLFGGRNQALIYTAVRQGRERQRGTIMTRLEADEFDGWSATSIAAELDRYHLDCGISYGLREIEAALARANQPVPQPGTPVVGGGGS